MTERAVVLGGGGIAGIAWEIGLLHGLAESGVNVLDADLFVGTSAGSAVAGQITSTMPLGQLYQRQVDPALQTPEIAAELDLDEITELWAKAYEDAVDADDMRRRIGAVALAAKTVPEADRRAVIEARLPSHEWPKARLLLVAADANTGEVEVFDRDSGVGLVDAVAASCAVPGTWPPVTIGASRYVDGGVRSAENADLAAGHARVLVLQAMVLPDVTDLDEQVESLRQQGSTVLVVTIDEAAAEAMGPNPLDPAVREPAARAGYEQGRRQAALVADLWR